MTWFRLDDGSHDHPKIEAAGNATWGFVCRLGAWSAQKLTDGFVPDAIVRRYGSPAERKRAVAVGLLIVADNDAPPDPRAHPGTYGRGVWLNDFLDRNPTRASVLAEREAARRRQQRGRDTQSMSRRDIGRDIDRTDTVSHGGPDPTRPDPTPCSTSRDNDDSRGTGTESSSSVETVLDEVVGRLALAAGKADHPGWKRATRTNQRTENADAIAQALAAGTPAAVIVQRILDRQPAHQPPPVDHAAANARSMIAGLVLTGTDPADAWQQALDSHPRHADAIAAELHARTGWTPPDTGTATVPPIRGAATQ